MTDLTDTIRAHYEAAIEDRPALLARLGAIIEKMPPPLTTRSFASFDQFHIGGLAATIELAKRAGVAPGIKVLDAGSGLGGPSRYLAEAHGTDVTGIDLSPAYVAIAALVAEKVGLGGKVHYRAGDITALPLDGGSVDLVWTQHVAMNIRDRAKLYGEFRRVLKPAGRLAFFDPYAPDSGEPPHYPVPWAEDPTTSTLLTRAETIAALEQAGFAVTAFDDVTELSRGWLAQQQQAVAQAQAAQTAPVLTTGLVVGPRMAEMVQNFGRNLKEGRVRLVMGLAQAH